MRIFLLRHGQTVWSLSGQHTGKTDIELTDVGREEARRVAPIFEHLLNGGDFDAIYTSPRRRALQTAELALTARNAASVTGARRRVTPIVTDLLAEFDYGDCEGLTAEQIRDRKPGWDFWTGECPGGESMAEVAARADQFIAMLRERADSREPVVCAVSHGHMIRILAARLLGLDAREGRIFDIKTASIAELVQKGERFAITRWNVTGDSFDRHG
jgi:broad specificity phosphatase PhoE